MSDSSDKPLQSFPSPTRSPGTNQQRGDNRPLPDLPKTTMASSPPGETLAPPTRNEGTNTSGDMAHPGPASESHATSEVSKEGDVWFPGHWASQSPAVQNPQQPPADIRASGYGPGGWGYGQAPPRPPPPAHGHYSTYGPGPPYSGYGPGWNQGPGPYAGQYGGGQGYEYGPPGRRYDEGSGAATGWRLFLMILHFILLLTTLIVNVLLAHSIPLLITHCCLAFAFLVYIPTAFILSAMRSTNRFDQAGGEVAYLVVQQAGWLASGILCAYYLAIVDCGEVRRIYQPSKGYRVQTHIFKELCHNVSAVLGLSFLHFLVLLAWMIWVIVSAHKADPRNPGRAFGVSTGVLVRGWRAPIHAATY